VRQKSTAQNYLDLSDINTSMNYRTWTKPTSYGSQMIDGWFEKQVKALTLVMLSLGQKRTD
jgi:hypothetical protein